MNRLILWFKATSADVRKNPMTSQILLPTHDKKGNMEAAVEAPQGVIVKVLIV
jgi:hypothetical protein